MSGGTALENLIDMLRSHGVSKFSDGTVTLEFFEGAFSQLPDGDEELFVENILSSEKKGKDGLTAEEQLALYGTIIDAEDSDAT